MRYNPRRERINSLRQEQADNDWFFDKFDNIADSFRQSPGKSIAKFGGAILLANLVVFLVVVGVITAAVLLVLAVA